MADKTIDRWTKEGEAFIKELEKLGQMQVNVGYLEKGRHNAKAQTYPDGTKVVDVAAYNELGTSTILPRPFIRRTAENNDEKFMRQVVKGVEDMIDGATAEQVLDELGVFAVGLLQDEIKNGDYVANAPATIAQNGSNQPLIDTGLLRQSASYDVRKK